MKTAEELATEYVEKEVGKNRGQLFDMNEVRRLCERDFLAGYNAREQWISVEDKPKKDIQNILVLDEDGKVYAGFYLEATEMFYEHLLEGGDMNCRTLIDGFTHYMIPTPPKQ